MQELYRYVCNSHLWGRFIFFLLLVGTYYMLWQTSCGQKKLSNKRVFLLQSHHVYCGDKYFSLIFDVLECYWIFVQLLLIKLCPQIFTKLWLQISRKKYAENLRKWGIILWKYVFIPPSYIPTLVRVTTVKQLCVGLWKQLHESFWLV